jgi:hypothetical protein
MQELLRLLAEEIDNFTSTPDKREYAISRCEELFDEHFVPIDLPGPDAIIDPTLRLVIRPVVGRIYDKIAKKLKV